jgi:cell division septation protein DedD
MKLKMVYFLVAALFVYSSCGNVKERKKNASEGNVENVTPYTDPVENDMAYDDTLSTNGSNTAFSGGNDYSQYASDSTDEIQNAVPEEIENSTATSTTNVTGTTAASTANSTTAANTTAAKTTTTNSTKTSSTTTKNATSKSTEYKKFYIVAGSFKELKKAQSLNKQFNKEGTKSTIAGPVKGFHRVIVGKYTSKKDALKELTTFRHKYSKLHFWLLGEN